jgi:hypothetical protein
MVMTVPAEDRTLSPKGGEEVLETALEAVAEQLRPRPNDSPVDDGTRSVEREALP